MRPVHARGLVARPVSDVLAGGGHGIRTPTPSSALKPRPARLVRAPCRRTRHTGLRWMTSLRCGGGPSGRGRWPISSSGCTPGWTTGWRRGGPAGAAACSAVRPPGPGSTDAPMGLGLSTYRGLGAGHAPQPWPRGHPRPPGRPSTDHRGLRSRPGPAASPGRGLAGLFGPTTAGWPIGARGRGSRRCPVPEGPPAAGSGDAHTPGHPGSRDTVSGPW